MRISEYMCERLLPPGECMNLNQSRLKSNRGSCRPGGRLLRDVQSFSSDLRIVHVAETGSEFATKPFPHAGGAVSIPHYDDWTIDRWRLEPRLHGLEIDDPLDSDVAPPLWKDLTLALAIAAALWMTAAIVFG